MDFSKLDEPVISSLAHKRKIKAETFSRNPAKTARLVVSEMRSVLRVC